MIGGSEPGTEHPNKNSFAIAMPIGVGVAMVLIGVVPQRSTQSAAYVFGQAMAWGLMAGLLTALLARITSFAWRWWFYPLVALALGFTLVGVSTLNDSPTSSGRTTTRVELVAPTSVGSLAPVDTPELQAERVKRERRIQRDIGAESVVTGYYAPTGQTTSLTFMGINALPGSGLDHEIDHSPAQGVNNYLAGAGVDDREYVEPGPLGGAMMCGPIEQGSVQGYVCAWATLGALGAVTFLDSFSGIDDAADRTREFRELAERAR